VAVSVAIHGLALFYVWQVYIHPETPGRAVVVQVDLIASYGNPVQKPEMGHAKAVHRLPALQEVHSPAIDKKTEPSIDSSASVQQAHVSRPSNPARESSAPHPAVAMEQNRPGTNRKPATRRKMPEAVQVASRSSPAVAPETISPGTVNNSLYEKRNLEILRRHLEAHKFYPASARRRGIEGDVKVGFDLDKRGRAGEISILAGSGHAVLDRAALKTVVRAQPFPVHGGAYSFRLRFRRL